MQIRVQQKRKMTTKVSLQLISDYDKESDCNKSPECTKMKIATKTETVLSYVNNRMKVRILGWTVFGRVLRTSLSEVKRRG